MSEGFPPLKDTCFSLKCIANLAIYYIVPVDWIAISEFPPTNVTSDIDSQKDGMSSGSKWVAMIERQLRVLCIVWYWVGGDNPWKRTEGGDWNVWWLGDVETKVELTDCSMVSLIEAHVYTPR